jgi:predicted NBD/HSP70 family sugar kinase
LSTRNENKEGKLAPHIASDLKDMNRRTVYNLISSADGISRAEISRKTGISSPTVLKIIDHFIYLDIVTMAGEGSSRLGRKPRMLKFNPNAAYAIGMEFDRHKLTAVLVNLAGEIVLARHFSNKFDISQLLGKHIVKYTEHIIKEAKITRNKILGLGIGIPGSVDPASKIITLAPSFGVLDRLDVSSYIADIEKKLGIPVVLERDVYAAAIGEAFHRQSDGDLLFIFIGAGVGAGIILDGKLRRGGAHMAGEIGYLSFELSSKIDAASMGWLESKIAEIGKAAGEAPGVQTGEALPLEGREIKKIANYLALAISALSISLDIGTVVLGGPMALRLGRPLCDAISTRIASLCLRPVSLGYPVSEYPSAGGLALLVTKSRIDSLLEGKQAAYP